MPQPAIEVEALSVRYPGGFRKPPKEAVRDVPFTVNKGEVVGFIGPNGAGKSTTIKTLMGYQRSASGTARILGCEVGTVESRSSIGFLPEVALHYPWLSAYETLHFFGKLQGIPNDFLKKQIPMLLDQVGLKVPPRERLKSFSKGMLQRVSIAQALLGDPQVLIMDEVSSGLDPVGRRDLRDLLLAQKEAGRAIFFSSHELGEVAQLCDRILMVNNGQIVEEIASGHTPFSTEELENMFFRVVEEGKAA